MKLVLPTTIVPTCPGHGPLFFLAGPTRGGGGWQDVCCKELSRLFHDFYAAIPYFPHNSRECSHVCRGIHDVTEQLKWKRHYFERASRMGCVILWLPEESKISPRPPGKGSYAQATIADIARSSVYLKRNSDLNIVIGAEPGFPELERIQANFQLEFGSTFPFHTSLRSVIEAAISTTGG